MKKNNYKVLILDTDGEISMEVPYLFSKAGCEADVFCHKSSWLLKNNYRNHWFESTTKKEAKTYVKELQNIVKNNSYDWIVFSDDDAIRFANKYITDKKMAQKILPLSKLENRIMLGSKAGLSTLCEKYNITHPSSEIYESSTNIKILAQKTGYPLLLKIDESSGGEGVFFCANEIDLVENFKKIPPEKRDELVCQKYIQGDNIAVEALYKNGNLLAYTYSKVINTCGNEFGVSSKREYYEYPKIESDLIKIGKSFGINAFVTMTFMLDKKTHKHYLVEADLRPQAWFRLATYVGVDFSKAIQNYFSNKNIILRPTLPKNQKKLVMKHFPRDFSHSLKKINIPELFKWLTNSDGRWRFTPWYDQKAFWNTNLGIVKRGTAFVFKQFSKSLPFTSYLRKNRLQFDLSLEQDCSNSNLPPLPTPHSASKRHSKNYSPSPVQGRFLSNHTDYLSYFE